jgi:hypothetical protein
MTIKETEVNNEIKFKENKLSEYKFRKSENGTDRMTVPQLFYSKKYEA